VLFHKNKNKTAPTHNYASCCYFFNSSTIAVAFFCQQLIGRFAVQPGARTEPGVISRRGCHTGPGRDAEGSSGTARRAALTRPPAGRLGAGCWAPSKQRGGGSARRRGRGRGKVVEPECRPAVSPGRRERRLLQRPHRRGHAPAVAARLAGAAARLVQHLQLRLGLRRVLLHALDGWCWGGVLVIPGYTVNRPPHAATEEIATTCSCELLLFYYEIAANQFQIKQDHFFFLFKSHQVK